MVAPTPDAEVDLPPSPAPPEQPAREPEPEAEAEPASPPTREFPTPEPEVEPAPAPPPAPPATPAPPPSVEPLETPFPLGLFFGAYGGFSPGTRRSFTLLTTLPVGALIGYEVLPARLDPGSQTWSVVPDPQYSRRGVATVRRDAGTMMAGLEQWNGIRVDFDVSGYPCDFSGPNHPEGCAMLARAWVAADLDGPAGVVRQPSAVLPVLEPPGDQVRPIRDIPGVFDLCSFEYFPGRCPRVRSGPPVEIVVTNLMWAN